MKISKSDPVQQWDTDRFCLGPSFNADRRLFRLYLRDFKGPQMSVLSRTSSNRLSTQSNLNGLFLGDSGGAKKKKNLVSPPAIHPSKTDNLRQSRKRGSSQPPEKAPKISHTSAFFSLQVVSPVLHIHHPPFHSSRPSITHTLSTSLSAFHYKLSTFEITSHKSLPQ